MKRRYRLSSRPLAMVVAVFMMVTQPMIFSVAGASDGLLSVAITGSVAGRDNRSPFSVLRADGMHRLMLDIAEAPRSEAFVKARLAETPYTLEDLLWLRMLRPDQGLYYLDFSLFTQDDQVIMMKALDEPVSGLVTAFEDAWPRINRILSAHPQFDALGPELRYAIIGCFVLDWEGLAVTLDEGYRAPQRRWDDGSVYLLNAREKGDRVSLRALFWGSHNSSYGDYTFTSFGDHVALPRKALPDIAGGVRIGYSNPDAEPELDAALGALSRYYLPGLFADGARLLAVLRNGPVEAETLAAETGFPVRQVDGLIDLFATLGYVRRDDDGIHALIPVLVKDDEAMLNEIVALGRNIMSDWLKAHYAAIKEAMANSTTERHGVPYREAFAEIWHFAFGETNRRLAERGLFVNPYADNAAFHGFSPFIYDSSIDE